MKTWFSFEIVEPPPFKEGVRINSPHYLVKLVDDELGPINYTLVVCQYEKYKSIYYTLRAYSTSPFELQEIKEPYKSKYKKTVKLFIFKEAFKILKPISNFRIIDDWKVARSNRRWLFEPSNSQKQSIVPYCFTKQRNQ